MAQIPTNSASAQEAKLQETIERIDNFRRSVALDDLDGQTAYGLTVRDMLVTLRGLAVGILPSHLIDRLNEIELDANDFVAASAAYAELEALVPAIKDAMEELRAFTGARPNCKGHCPSCGPDKNASVLASKKRIQEGSYGLVSTTKHYRLLQCLACDSIYFQYESAFSDDWDIVRDPYTGEEKEILRSTIKHWPLPSVLPIPTWEDELNDTELQDLLKETHGALDSGFLVLAAIGARTALDRALILKGANRAHGLARKLKELEKSGVITREEHQLLSVLTEAGNAAAHASWKPDLDELISLVRGVEIFIQRAFIQKIEVAKLKKGVPPRAQRQKKTVP